MPTKNGNQNTRPSLMTNIIFDGNAYKDDVKQDSDERNSSDISWCNSDNDRFYSEIKAEGLKKLAAKAGLSKGCDVQKLQPHWINAKTILDVGSGYGRVVNSLLDLGFKGHITATERNPEQLAQLSTIESANLTIVPIDISNINKLNRKFDIILYLWSGLADFPKNRQSTIIRMLAELLNKDGKIIIDTMPMNTLPLDTEEFDQQSFLTRSNNHVVHTYEPSYAEIQKYAMSNGLNHLELMHCKTDTNRERWLYVLVRFCLHQLRPAQSCIFHNYRVL